MSRKHEFQPMSLHERLEIARETVAYYERILQCYGESWDKSTRQFLKHWQKVVSDLEQAIEKQGEPLNENSEI
jgi:hypothetical protein